MTKLPERFATLSPQKLALVAQNQALNRAIINADPIAIVGIGCRFPQDTDTPERYWQLLCNGIDAVTEVPTSRWNTDDFYNPDPDAPGKIYTRYGSFLTQIDNFDPAFFGISPREARMMDPQQRLLLEVSWESLEHAGIDPSSLRGSQTGVFIGMMAHDYSYLSTETFEQIDAYTATGSMMSVAAGRLAYFLGSQGPTFTVDTTCSSSLVSLHLACQSLRTGECDLALAGGVQLMLSPHLTIMEARLHMFSADGRCKAFDQAADGMGRGEGCGVLVLKRLADAITGGDKILALVRGSAVNHDGRSSGLTVPNGVAQQRVMQQALASGGISAEQVSYVETHGTGTPVGDLIEVGALESVYGRDREVPLFIGSVKTNIGHTEGAAGVAGVIKVILALQHAEIPPNLHFHQPNPQIPWQEYHITVPTERQPWPAGDRRLAAVSSFGMSGTNAHIVLEAAPADLVTPAQPEADRPLHLLTLSATTQGALRDLAQRYATHLTTASNQPLGDLCFTANTGRAQFTHRLAIVADTPTALYEKLTMFTTGEIPLGAFAGQAVESKQKIAFLFTGQGAQYSGMGRELYETSAAFRATLDHCDELLHSYVGESILAILYPEQKTVGNGKGAGNKAQDAGSNVQAKIDDTTYTQPALFMLEYALATLWQSWGIQPDLLMGHSVGELVAACLAGVFSLEDGLKLVAARGRLMGALPEDGAMVAVLTSEAHVCRAIEPYKATVSIAAVNSATSIVISGKAEAVSAIAAQLAAEGIKTRRLTVSHAFHSPLVEPMLDEFRRVAATITYHKPRMRLVSNVTGKVADDEIATPDYWVRHVRAAVRFADGVNTLHEHGINMFLEIGPKPTLLGMVEEATANCSLPSLRQAGGDWSQLLTSLGALYVNGSTIQWEPLDQNYRRHKVVLPTYPFQRQRYWIDAAKQKRNRRTETALCPLVNRMIKLPQQKQTVFESAFSVETLPFLADHIVFDTVISPGACQLATVLTSADLVFGAATVELSDVLLPQALVLPTTLGANGATQQEERTVQVISTPVAANGTGPREEFTLLSFDPNNPATEPATHAMGYLATATTTPPVIDLATLQQRFADETLVVIDTSSKNNVATTAIALGPSFQWITHLRRQETDGQAETLAQLHLPAVIEDFADYLLHPGLLDACFQVAGAATSEETEGTMLPFGLHSLHFYKSKRANHRSTETPTWWCHATQVDKHKWDITLLDNTGTVLIAIERFETRQATPAAVQHQNNWRDWLYGVEWQERPFFGLPLDYLPALETLTEGMAEQLFSQQTSVADQRQLKLYAALEKLSTDYIVTAFAKAGFTFQVGQRWQLQQAARQLGVIPQYHRLLARLLTLLTEAGLLSPEDKEAGKEVWRVLAAPPLADPQSVLTTLHADYGDLPELRLLARCGTRLSEVLRGAQEPLELLFPGGNDETVRQFYIQSPVMQAVNTLMIQAMKQIVAQLPGSRGLRILEIGAGTGSTTAALLPHLPADRTDYLFTDIGSTFLSQAAVTFADYEFIRYQTLDIEQSLSAQGFSQEQADLIVAANVLHATKDLGETIAHVRQLLAPGGLLLLLESTTPNAFADLTFGLTDGWWRFADDRQDYPLLTANEWTTLLQAHGFAQVAATEVDGQAVIVAQVASHPVGSRSATAGQVGGQLIEPPLAEPGTEQNHVERSTWLLFADQQGIAKALADQLHQHGKRAVLVEAGDSFAQIADSTFHIHPDRAADYQQLLATMPQVQQIVHLWSLDTPALGDQTDLLTAAQQGCGTALHLVQALFYQQINPAGLWLVTQDAQATSAQDQVAGVTQSPLWGMGKVIGLEHPELTCRLLDLENATQMDNETQATALYATINSNGMMLPVQAEQPLHERAFALRNTSQGLRCYVPRLNRATVEATQPITIAKDATYLITGGLGGVGLEIAHWLAKQGAGQLILLGRSAPKAALAPQLDQIRALGTKLTIAQVDVTDREQIAALLMNMEEAHPLRGIIHAVGVLEDAALMNQSREHFANVLRPKVQGAWHLHELTQSMALDFFVLFSSMASLLGNRGQANHAAANAFLDAFAHYRQAQGQPALSINWGAWSEIGAAAALVHANQQQMATGGMSYMTPTQGVAAFATLLQQAIPQAGVLPITWAKYSQSAQAEDPFYANFVERNSEGADQRRTTQPTTQRSIRQELATADPAARHGLVVGYVQEVVAKILGMNTSPAPKVGFTELGMDSLMAIELRRQLERMLQLSLPSTVAFDYPTANALALYILEHILQLPTDSPTNGNQELNEIEQLTDDALLSLVGQAFAELV